MTISVLIEVKTNSGVCMWSWILMLTAPTPFSAGWVLAAFFYGYLITQIPGGLLAQRVGGKWVFGVGVVMTAILTLFTTVAAEKSVWLLVALRVLEGFFEVSSVADSFLQCHLKAIIFCFSCRVWRFQLHMLCGGNGLQAWKEACSLPFLLQVGYSCGSCHSSSTLLRSYAFAIIIRHMKRIYSCCCRFIYRCYNLFHSFWCLVWVWFWWRMAIGVLYLW